MNSKTRAPSRCRVHLSLSGRAQPSRAWQRVCVFGHDGHSHAQFLLLVVAGWVNRQQQDVIDYQQKENRVLRAGLRGKRLRLSDDDRRRLAVKAQALDREALKKERVVSPQEARSVRRCVTAGNRDGAHRSTGAKQPIMAGLNRAINAGSTFCGAQLRFPLEREFQFAIGAKQLIVVGLGRAINAGSTFCGAQPNPRHPHRSSAVDNVAALDLWLGCSVRSRKVGQHQVNSSPRRSSVS